MDSPPKPRQYALRFISGKYQGGEFPISGDKDIFIGRANDLEVVLVEDMVSRKHARVSLQGDVLSIEDLGSTNGTFVNGEKIKRARLKEGDRVLIGTSIIRVAMSEAGADASDPKARMQDVAAARRTSQVRTMTGTIEEVPLVDLLQLFTTSKKSGVLVLRRDDDVGRVFLRRGTIIYASINENSEIAPLKSVYRLLTWEHGTFELDPPDEREFAEELNVSTEAILMEGMRQLDELKRLGADLPGLNAHLSLPSPLVPPLRDLSPAELDVLQLAINFGHMESILNRSRANDLETCEILVRLLQKQYVRVD
jgi:pSer/pThr/pTyr-binding forkhead associated (FHA) protein